MALPIAKLLGLDLGVKRSAVIWTLSDVELNVFEKQSLNRSTLNVTLMVDSVEYVQAFHLLFFLLILILFFFGGQLLGPDCLGSLLLVVQRLLE